MATWMDPKKKEREKRNKMRYKSSDNIYMN